MATTATVVIHPIGIHSCLFYCFYSSSYRFSTDHCTIFCFKRIIIVQLKKPKYIQKEYITVGCVPPTLKVLIDHIPWHPTPWMQTPWKQTPLDTDPRRQQQNDWQTGVKTLTCPKLRLQAVIMRDCYFNYRIDSTLFSGEIEQDASHLHISSHQQCILTARWAENTDTGTNLKSEFGFSQKRQQPIIKPIFPKSA